MKLCAPVAFRLISPTVDGRGQGRVPNAIGRALGRLVIPGFAKTLKPGLIAGMVLSALSGAMTVAKADGVSFGDPADFVRSLDVTLLTEEYPPFNYLDETGKLRGIGAEVVQAMAARLGYAKRIEVMAWKRALQQIDTESNIGVFSMTRTPQREDLYRWVGPLVPTNAGIFQLVDTPNLARSLDDLRHSGLIGVQAGGADETALRSYGFENLEPLHNPRVGVQMLAAGRISMIVSSDIELFEQLRNSPLERDDLEMVYAFSSGDLYLAFLKTTPDAVIRAWQHAYDHIIEDGQFDRIMAEYGVIEGQSPRISGSLSHSQ